MKKELFPYVVITFNVVVTALTILLGITLYDVVYESGSMLRALFVGPLYALLLYQLFQLWEISIKIWKESD